MMPDHVDICELTSRFRSCEEPRSSWLVKKHAKELREYLKQEHNLDLCHGRCLDLVSRVFGHKNWNVFSAYLKGKE